MIRMAKPSHPGQFIRMEIIEPLGLSVTEAANVLGVARPALYLLHNQKSASSLEIVQCIDDFRGLRAICAHEPKRKQYLSKPLMDTWQMTLREGQGSEQYWNM
jgi:hypothetical protein